MQKQTIKPQHSLLIASLSIAFALTLATDPARGFGFILGDQDNALMIQDLPTTNTDDHQADEPEDSQELAVEPEDDKPQVVPEKLEIRSINIQSNGKTIKNSRQVEVKNQGKATIIKSKSQLGNQQEIQVEEHEEDDGQVTNEIQIETKNKGDEFKIKVKTGSNGFVLEDSRFTAKTNYPLSVNSDTNELTITTPSGIKTVTVLPDAAIANMLRRGVLDTVAAAPPGTASASLEPGSTPEPGESEVELVTTSEGEVAYKVKGGKAKRLFGFIPVRIDKNILISADTGEIVTDQPAGILDAFFNILSI